MKKLKACMYTHRLLEQRIYHSFQGHYITAILGARRVGKSTLVQNFIEANPQLRWVVLNLDNLATRQAIQNQKLKILIEQQLLSKVEQCEKIWVVVDEAQKTPELFEQVKLLYDQYHQQHKIKFILTGSGALSLHELSAETLAGRIELFYLRPFNLREAYVLQAQAELPELFPLDILFKQPEKFAECFSAIQPFQTVLTEVLQQQLVWGGLPEVLSQNQDVDKISYLGNYLQTYLEKDVRAVKQISDMRLYQHLLEVLAKQTGSIRDDKKLIDTISCARDTLKKYRGYLLATLMYDELYPFIDSSLKRLVKSPKGYLCDNGLISYLTGLYELEILKNTGLLGHRFENWFLNQLKSFLDLQPKKHNIFFWRTSGDVEVDFIAKVAPNIYPFEVTVKTKKDNKKIKHLQQFMAESPESKFGYYIYLGDFDFDETKNIYFIPAWALV